MHLASWRIAVFLVLVAASAQAGELRAVLPVQRPVDILPADKVAYLLSHLPPIWDDELRAILSNPDTMFYDRTVIIPGYQDSYGDGMQFPIGFRPNTIRAGMIAVPGGHAELFIRRGEFRFPFGRTGGVNDAANTFVVDFWQLPREGGKLLPVVWWKWEPNQYTHRVEWMFPLETVFGEILFLVDSNSKPHIFEIRTRKRNRTGWSVDVFRPFPTARELAEALSAKAQANAKWNTSLVSQAVRFLRDNSTLQPASLAATRYYRSAFPPVSGATDTVPELGDPSLVADLLRTTTFRSVKNTVWKRNGGLEAYAASTDSDFSIVPKNYNAALFPVTDAFCSRCHEDAGRPFRDYYSDVMLYGELWGEDDVFSWHPFDSRYFVNAQGECLNFNNGSRRFRQDFLAAGVLESYDPSAHTSQHYEKLQRAWKNYIYR